MFHLLRSLPSDVIQSHVVCERTDNLDVFSMPNIHDLCDRSPLYQVWDKGLRRLGFRNHLAFVADVAVDSGAEVLHSHFGNLGWANLAVARRAGLRHLVTFYGYDVNQLPQLDPRWRDRYARLFEEADCFLCEGEFMASALVAMGCPDEKVIVQHLGVDVGQISYRPRSWNGEGPLRVLIAATFREKKGVPDALEAIGKLSKSMDLEVTIIGDATKEPRSLEEKRKIEAVIARYGMKNEVRMIGFQPHEVIFNECYEHHIFLSPSVTAGDGDTEGGVPVSIIEMMATGLPVVSTNHCDIPGVVQYGKADWLVDERDVDGLVERMKWLVANPENWREMLDRGRAHVERNFDLWAQGQRLAEIYQRLG